MGEKRTFVFIHANLPFRLGRHGIGSLRHPFDYAANAMSSAGAARTQWDLMQNPKRRIFRWRFDKFVGRPGMLKTWETLRFKGLPDYICKDAGFIEKVSIAKVDIGNIERTFCDDESSRFLYDLIKGNNFETKQLQALCGDFEHCVPEDGEGLLAIYDFIKDAKKDNLTDKALEFYNSEYRTLTKKPLEYLFDKFPELANAFAQEFVAYVFVNILDKYYKCSNNNESFYFPMVVSDIVVSESCLETCFNSLHSVSSNREKRFLCQRFLGILLLV